jgi:hypothetical protein
MPIGSPTLGDPVDVGDLVARIQRDLRGSTREGFDILATEIGTGDSSATTTFAVPSIAEQALIAIDEEILLVTACSGTSISIIRGVFNTNVTAHAAGAVIEAEPAFFPSAIGDAIVEEIRSWPIELHRERSATVAFGAVDEAVSWTPTGFRYPLEAFFTEASGDHAVNVAQDVVVNSSIVRRTDRFGVSGDLALTYAADFTLASVGFTTTLADVGLPASCYDIVVYGVLWRLLAPRDIQVLDRTAQPQPRAAEDTQAGRTVSVAATYKQLRDQRIAEEATRLRNAHPWSF